MENQELISRLEKEWDLEQGFLGKLRMGLLDVDNFGRLKETLQSIDFEDDGFVNRRIVSLIWYIPLFMNWQRERYIGDDKKLQLLDQAINETTSILEDILGIP